MVTFFITLVVYVKHMKKSEWLDCQRNEFFPKQKGIPSLVKIEHKNTATLDSARSKKKSKVAVLQLINFYCVHFILHGAHALFENSYLLNMTFYIVYSGILLTKLLILMSQLIFDFS